MPRVLRLQAALLLPLGLTVIESDRKLTNRMYQAVFFVPVMLRNQSVRSKTNRNEERYSWLEFNWSLLRREVQEIAWYSQRDHDLG